MTEQEAWDLLYQHYPSLTIEDDPEWAWEMVDALVAGEMTLP